MKRMVFLRFCILLYSFFSFADAKYMDNHSCKECHENIYEEFQGSQHSKSYFNDELHRKIANAADKKKYACATCHMPMADNINDLLSGKARPDRANKTHTDAISCYFCHTIAYVKKAHKFNINTKARQAENYKPTLYGRLVNPDESDKHSSASNPVYAKKVCTGCHSHKLNDNNVTIFHAMDETQNSLGCIKCHMPEIEGGAEKMDKRARGHHASHRFLGIHDKAFRKTGVDIGITVNNGKLDVTLTNKMEHPLIIQPARAKFLKIEIMRKGKVIWRNYKSDPAKDKQGYFAYSFKRDGKKIIVPATATEGSVHNLNAKETKVLQYDIPSLEKGDVVMVSLYVQLGKSDCASAIELEDKSLMEPSLIKKVTLKF
ncbi:multiheme c-type cytochrome [Sulfurovum sp. NBC37-1]|uniref:multiheme c-type cytochrome n=1 Tax=Sulfurovum sp. (strain NBC37-1) TaxID=387093 RepID=UPI0002E7C826|nr:multiheme c-type cytochrome [Sulfurovum sp. NBC37-1]